MTNVIQNEWHISQKITDRLVQTCITRFPALLVKRAENANKGQFGNAIIIGGINGMSGAVCLAASAALLMGCGKSYACFCQTVSPMPISPNFPEIIVRNMEQLSDLHMMDVIALGCGMGSELSSLKMMMHVIDWLKYNPIPCILDADALNMMASHYALANAVTELSSIKILTPHPAEAARLLSVSTEEIQSSREQAALELAKRYRAWIVLKGQYSIICSPNGAQTINDSGNAGLATAGSGDVLTGMLAGVLSQKIPSELAIAATVWLHGAAAEYLGDGYALSGLVAGEIASAARKLRHLAMMYMDTHF